MTTSTLKAVHYFVNFAIDSKRLDETVRYESVEAILRRLKLINKQGQITFAALMLFGKDIEDYCLSASFRIGRFGKTQADLIFDDNIACPLIRMPETIMQTLRSRYLIAPVKYEGIRRIEPLEIPEDALREMICNSIVHKDYRGTFIQMRVWDDHIDLWNSGTFPPEITPENLMDFHESHPRNELIAKVFYMAGFIESWGRGYEKIKNAFMREQLQIPSFEQVRGGILASIPRERFAALNKQNVNNIVDTQLSERQRKIYLMVQNWSISEPLDEPLNTTSISKLTGISLSTVKRELTVLQQRKLIIRVGGRKEGHWEIIK